ncbi:MAG TPA: hypothetical protein VEL47_06620 [Myxococcota bacterium]|nr:hypothetical protein [Myxococcota bacterium]
MKNGLIITTFFLSMSIYAADSSEQPSVDTNAQQAVCPCPGCRIDGILNDLRSLEAQALRKAELSSEELSQLEKKVGEFMIPSYFTVAYNQTSSELQLTVVCVDQRAMSVAHVTVRFEAACEFKNKYVEAKRLLNKLKKEFGLATDAQDDEGNESDNRGDDRQGDGDQQGNAPQPPGQQGYQAFGNYGDSMSALSSCVQQ